MWHVLECTDDGMMFKGRTGQYMACPDLIEEEDCKCIDTFGPYVIAEKCCASCQGRGMHINILS